MFKPIKTLLCFTLCFSLVIISGCISDESSNQFQNTISAFTQAPITTEAVTVNNATADSANGSTSYNYVRIKEKTSAIMSDFDSYINRHSYNGAVYYKIGNDFEYIGSNGMAIEEEHTSNSINTLYYAGSITKQFTAAAVLLLAEDDKLSIDDTLDKYYPSYSCGNKITVYNLLTMTSGIKSYMSGDGSIDSNIPSEDLLGFNISKDNTAKENKANIIKWIFNENLIFEPDTEYKYSDSNYFILGDIIEKVSGVSYENFVTDNIIKPLGMNSTVFEVNDKVASGYQGTNNISWIKYPGVAYSSTGLITNISDLLKWISALDEYEILSEESVDIMFTPYKENYGCGMFVNGEKSYQMSRFGQHGGMLSFMRNESEIYVSFTNYYYSNPVNLYAVFKKNLRPYTI